jgi:4-amino-4-deoxy-L-arabinose transferase-like glycosyltransferase
MDKLILALPVTVFFLILLWYVDAYRLFYPEGHRPAPYAPPETPRLATRFPKQNITRRDIRLMAGITLAYGLVAFTFLGNLTGPTSCRAYEPREESVFDFGAVTEIAEVKFFSSLHTGDYRLEYSADGEVWKEFAEMTQKYNELFKWRSLVPEENLVEAKYVRLTALSRLDLAEIAFRDKSGGALLPQYDEADSALFDEQDTVPPRASYMNSSYFDEIYHPRTALENIEGVYPYEVSHPPLGKLILSLGIRLFGMTPFGWRFMGTLFGTLMLPILYVLLKLLFGSTPAAAAGTFVFAFDFMHFVQTRIATIDTYAVFFILLSFLCMALFVRQDPDETRLRHRLLPLGRCGLVWGIGCASKWTVIYFGAALAVIWLGYWICRGVYLKKTGRLGRLVPEFLGNSAFCVLVFICVPAVVYYLSYYPYGAAKGLHGIGAYFKKEYLDIVLENQKFMFTYHADLTSTHPYASRWWQWVIDARPILYFLDYPAFGMKSAFGAFNGPMVCWGGLVAMLVMVWRVFRRRDFRAFMILAGYLSSLVPWIIISRPVFAYHYFPCMLFLAVALSYVFALIDRAPGGRPWLYSYCAGAGALFFLFYPALTGVAYPTWYFSMLRWFPTAWPF